MWWGVAAALLANVLYSTGFVLEKRALAALPEVTIRQPGTAARGWSSEARCGSAARSRWPPGSAAQLAVYRTLPIAAAQGIFVSGLVLLVLLSARLLGEETTRPRTVRAGAILAALLMVVLSLKEGVRTRSAGAPRTADPAGLRAVAGGGRVAVRVPPSAAPGTGTACRPPASSTAWRWACCTGSARSPSRACRAV